jgi:glutamyl-tRNA reductase
MMTKLQAAIIGLGFVGKTHAEALRRMGIPIRGVLERTKDLSEKAAERLGDIQAYSDMDELVADEDVSVVHICTPNYLPLAMNSRRHLNWCSLLNQQGMWAQYPTIYAIIHFANKQKR